MAIVEIDRGDGGSQVIHIPLDGLDCVLYISDDKSDPHDRTVARLTVGKSLTLKAEAIPGRHAGSLAVAALVSAVIQCHAEVRDALAEER